MEKAGREGGREIPDSDLIWMVGILMINYTRTRIGML